MPREETTIIGIDCATDDARVGVAAGVAHAGRCEVRLAEVCSSEREVADEVEVYPAATLLAHGIPARGYKKKE